MVIEQETYKIGEDEVVLRCADVCEASMLLKYLKTVSSQTKFLMCESNEVCYTLKQEEDYIKRNNKSLKSLLLLAFVNGEFAGTCSFDRKLGSRRYIHRASVGIALLQEFTERGIGTLMFTRLLEEAKRAGYEKCELSLVEGNDIAYNMYKKLGFRECGRISKANKYADGTYADEILMEVIF